MRREIRLKLQRVSAAAFRNCRRTECESRIIRAPAVMAGIVGEIGPTVQRDSRIPKRFEKDVLTGVLR